MTATLDAQQLRTVMSRWVTGVAVVTSRDEAGPRGATTNALTSLSLEPLLVLVCLDEASNTLRAVRASGRFCVNVLAEGQEEVARRFATKQSGTEKLAGVPHDLVEGMPILRCALAWLVCSLEQEHQGGDHAILVGRPFELHVDDEQRPLVFLGGRYSGVGAVRE